MIRLSASQLASLRHWFQPERPGPLIGMHILAGGVGYAYTDRWPHPRLLLTETGGNYSLAGDPDAVDTRELKPLIRGFVEAPDHFVPLLQDVWPETRAWPRLVYALDREPQVAVPNSCVLRRLSMADTDALIQLDASTAWIAVTWGGPEGLAQSGYAWGAFMNGKLASVACSFFVGERYEDVGIVTEPTHRRAGLAVAVVAALCVEIRGRNRTPTWATSVDNSGSQRVAEKVGFRLLRKDRLFPIGMAIPSG